MHAAQRRASLIKTTLLRYFHAQMQTRRGIAVVTDKDPHRPHFSSLVHTYTHTDARVLARVSTRATLLDEAWCVPSWSRTLAASMHRAQGAHQEPSACIRATSWRHRWRRRQVRGGPWVAVAALLLLLLRLRLRLRLRLLLLCGFRAGWPVLVLGSGVRHRCARSAGHHGLRVAPGELQRLLQLAGTCPPRKSCTQQPRSNTRRQHSPGRRGGADVLRAMHGMRSPVAASGGVTRRRAAVLAAAAA